MVYKKRLINILILLCFCFCGSFSFGQQKNNAQDKLKNNLIFPGLLKKEELESGNPLATYAAMIKLEKEYRSSKIFAKIYPEVRFNFEQFLGFPLAGMQAMQYIAPNGFKSKELSIAKQYKPVQAIHLIEKEAQKTQIVIWAEEHHLPQTRSLYEALLKKLWKQGYRYLAAETFSKNVMESDFKYPTYKSGYYTRDPIFASAVRTAKKLNYKLISYDTAERGKPGDSSFRDRKQAENIKERIFDKDKSAKVLIFAGRGHASEVVASDGWTPMANVLKKITGIDPFTIYAPTMTERLNKKHEHPLYRDAIARQFVKQPVIFINKENNHILAPNFCDAYVFFPKSKFIKTRPDWMIRELKRKKVKIPKQFLNSKGVRLIQAFELGEPNNAIPVDQILIDEKNQDKLLMLPVGKFRLRIISEDGKTINSKNVEILN